MTPNYLRRLLREHRTWAGVVGYLMSVAYPNYPLDEDPIDMDSIVFQS